MKAYYAHCMAIYNTKQEERDLLTLTDLGFDVLNPNTPEVSQGIKAYKEQHPSDYMSYFKNLVEQCPVFVFRALPDGKIPSGVAKELEWAQQMNKFIIELPSAVSQRTLTHAETIEYLKEIGQR